MRDKETMQKNRGLAIAAGDKHFYHGRLCANGHDSPRLASCGACVECRRNYQRKRARTQRKSANYLEYQANYQARYRLSEHGATRIKAAQDKYRARKKDEKKHT